MRRPRAIAGEASSRMSFSSSSTGFAPGRCPYAALGIAGTDGRMVRFITSGIDAAPAPRGSGRSPEDAASWA